MRWRNVVAGAIAVAGVISVTLDRVDACLFPSVLITVHSTAPGERAAFARGDVGVVPPTYARLYLVGAYRRFSGLPTTGLDVEPARESDVNPIADWLKARDMVLHRGELTASSLELDPWRVEPNYEDFLNCNGDAFAVAARTLDDRARRYGVTSATVSEWLRAQDAVFANCHDGPAVLPQPASASADTLTRADRAYQTAAALFYACDFENAATRFRMIAEDGSSPWHVYGRLLAGRALMRRASLKLDDVAKSDATRIAARADAEFAATESDGALPSSVRESAATMRHLMVARMDPLERLHQLSAQARQNGPWTQQDTTDFALLFNDVVSTASSYDYQRLANREAITASDDLLDWVITLQGTGAGATDHAEARWKRTQSMPWLVAALWKASENSADGPALLRAAAAVRRDSPAFATVTFLRVKLLFARGSRPEAARVLAQLPHRPVADMPMETINLFRALRLNSATTLDSWLTAAPRYAVSDGADFQDATPYRRQSEMTLDQDAARALSEQFPLPRLIQTAESARLPSRLRLIVAGAAWTRAAELNDDTSGVRLAPLLKALAPRLAPEIDQYLAAPDADQRHDRAVLMILRWPTFRNYVPLADWAPDGAFLHFTMPVHMSGFEIRAVWWCGFDTPTYRGTAGPYEESPVTRLEDFLPSSSAPPAFLSGEDRARAKSEWTQLAAIGAAPDYLTREAIVWAKARPNDRDVPEALALAVQGTHTTCTDKQTGPLSHEAFGLLHSRYPATIWAKKTKYWYAR